MASPTSTQKSPTGIDVIIVGAGFGGLTAAIECHRQGHNVSIYENFPSLKALGDIISFGPNAGRIFRRWGVDGSIAKQMREVSINLQTYGFNIHKWTGELMCNQPTPPRDESAPMFNGHRGELHTIVFYHALNDLKIPIYLGCKVIGYSENSSSASITLEDGRVVTGDVVIGSDGVRSIARELVLGYTDKPKSSGYAVFRAWFSNKDMIADPETAHFCNNGDTFNGWIGPDVHFLFSTIKNGSDCCWVLTHKDDADIDESWSFPGKLEDVYKVFEGWDPLCKRIVSKTPESCLVDWKLVYRDPLPTWVSPQARTALLGDSAHPFLPTSAQGATQSMEDGVTLAVCLRKAGKDRVAEAVRAYMDIRYERVKAVQKTGETTRDMWHKADWEKVKEDPSAIHFPRQDWIFEFDAEKHTEEVYDEVVRARQVKDEAKSTMMTTADLNASSKLSAFSEVKEVTVN